MSSFGIDLVAQERSRQVKKFHYDREHDKGNADLLMDKAATQLREAFYIYMEHGDDRKVIKALTKVGALSAAIIDVIQDDY